MRGRFVKKLDEQLRFVERSCTSFDFGMEDEAVRIATSLRIIFHDTSNSTSLLSHLNLKGGKMVTSPRGHGNWQDFLGQKIDLSSPNPINMVPLLKSQFAETSMDDWWEGAPAFVHDEVPYSRKRIILSIANKDGGAHIDEKLEIYYQVLCEGKYALGIEGSLEYKGEAPFEQGVWIYPNNAHLALVRQFAHETLASAKHYGWPRSEP